jgi:hypothetical protein
MTQFNPFHDLSRDIYQQVTATLVRCPNCHRGVDEKWHYCAYCAFRLLNEDGTRRIVKVKK